MSSLPKGTAGSKDPATTRDRAVFLDRDGTLMENDGDLGDPSKVVLLPHVSQGLVSLRENGFKLIVVTNQGGVARGKYDEAAVVATHARLETLLCQATGLMCVIDAFYFCPFHPEGSVSEYRREHAWRKPSPGMLQAAALDHGIDLASSWIIGDQERDVQAGAAAGCRSILIGSPHGNSAADYFATHVNEAASRILQVDAPTVLASVVTLHAANPNVLNDKVLRSAITTAAESLAERSGVRLVSLEWSRQAVTSTVQGGELIALGLAAELRRTTDRWWQVHGGSTPLWAGE